MVLVAFRGEEVLPGGGQSYQRRQTAHSLQYNDKKRTLRSPSSAMSILMNQPFSSGESLTRFGLRPHKL